MLIGASKAASSSLATHLLASRGVHLACPPGATLRLKRKRPTGCSADVYEEECHGAGAGREVHLYDQKSSATECARQERQMAAAVTQRLGAPGAVGYGAVLHYTPHYLYEPSVPERVERSFRHLDAAVAAPLHPARTLTRRRSPTASAIVSAPSSSRTTCSSRRSSVAACSRTGTPRTRMASARADGDGWARSTRRYCRLAKPVYYRWVRPTVGLQQFSALRAAQCSTRNASYTPTVKRTAVRGPPPALSLVRPPQGTARTGSDR